MTRGGNEVPIQVIAAIDIPVSRIGVPIAITKCPRTFPFDPYGHPIYVLL